MNNEVYTSFSACPVTIARFRGVTEEEIIQTINSEKWTPAELGRLECSKDFPFGKEWNGEKYATKRIRPVFVEEATEVVVVTVYAYYF